MRRLIAGLLLGVLGLSLVVHPLVHGLENDPSTCAVTRGGCENPAQLPLDTPAVSPVPGFLCDYRPYLAPDSRSCDVSSASRGPPQA